MHKKYNFYALFLTYGDIYEVSNMFTCLVTRC